MPPTTADPEPDAPPTAAEEESAASDWHLRQQQAAEFDRLNWSLVFIALELAAELKVRVFAASERFMLLLGRVADAAVDGEQHTNHWLSGATRAAAESGLPCKDVAVPPPTTCSVPPQQMSFIGDSFGDIKTELQLLHASVQDLKAAEQDGQYQTEMRLRHLQGQLTRMSISASHRPAAGQPPSRPLFASRPAGRLPPSLLGSSETGRYYRHGRSERPMLQLRRVELPRMSTRGNGDRPAAILSALSEALARLAAAAAMDDSISTPPEDADQQFVMGDEAQMLEPATPTVGDADVETTAIAPTAAQASTSSGENATECALQQTQAGSITHSGQHEHLRALHFAASDTTPSSPSP